jgi:hypothetical protein
MIYKLAALDIAQSEALPVIAFFFVQERGYIFSITGLIFFPSLGN